MTGGQSAGPPRLGGGDVLRLAAWFGLVAGLVESLSHVGRWIFETVPLRLGLYLTWMPAAANLLFFTAVGLLLIPLHRRWPRLLTPPRLVGIFATMAGMAALRELDGHLGVITVDIIALGLGVQAAQRLGARWVGFSRFLRPAVPGLLGLLMAVAVGIEVRYRLLERRTLLALPAPAAGVPNVLLLILDTVRSENLSAYGYHLETSPVIGRLAEEGVRFGRAYSTAPWTLPSHASMMTGRWSHELTASWHTPLDRRDSTLAEALAARGYRTGGMVANLSYTSRWTGLDRGFAHYDAQRISLPQVLRTAAFTAKLYEARPFRDLLPPAWRDYRRKSAREVNDELLAWLDRSPPRPFFAFLNYLDAHEPYLPLAPFDTAFAGVDYPPLPPAAHGGLHKDDRPRPMRPYDQAIAYIDAELGRLLAELERRGLRENTLIIVSSDHGEEFGEHGIYGHGHTLYLPSLSVPLVVNLPGKLPGGLVVEARTSLRDLPATIMDLVSDGGNQPFPGASLARFWRSPNPALDTLLVGTRWARNRPAWDATSRGDLQGLLAGDLAFMRDVELKGELYQLASDSAQRRNLAGDPGWADSTAALHAYLTRNAGVPARAPAGNSE